MKRKKSQTAVVNGDKVQQRGDDDVIEETPYSLKKFPLYMQYNNNYYN